MIFCAAQRHSIDATYLAQVRPPDFDAPSKSDSTRPSTSKSAKATPRPSHLSSLSQPQHSPSSTISQSRNATPTTQPIQPLKASPSNALPTNTSNGPVAADGDEQKDRYLSPLGTANANITGKANTNASTNDVKGTTMCICCWCGISCRYRSMRVLVAVDRTRSIA